MCDWGPLSDSCAHGNELEFHKRRVFYRLAQRSSDSHGGSASWSLYRTKCDFPHYDFQKNRCVSFGRPCSGGTTSVPFRDFRVDTEARWGEGGIVPIWFIRTCTRTKLRLCN
jgi:hypothetical protein